MLIRMFVGLRVKCMLLWSDSNQHQNDKMKGKGHNSQTQQYFYSIRMIYCSIMGYMFRLLSCHLQALKMYVWFYILRV